MKIEMNYQKSVLVLPGAALDKLETATDEDLRVLLCLAAAASTGEDVDAAKLAVRLSIPEQKVENAISFWRGAGVLKTVKTKKQTEKESEKTGDPAPVTMQSGLPAYSGKEIEEIMKKRKRLGQLLEECQKILDRVFNVSESNLVIAMVDLMHFDDDYILLLCSYCLEKKDGSVTMKYVYSTAYRLYEENVLTVHQLEEYIAKEEESRDFANYMRRLFGVGARALSAKEKKFFESFRAMSFPKEVYLLAYETTVDQTGEASLPYMSKILTGWHKAGVKDVEGAKAETERHKEEYAKILPSGKKGEKKKSNEFTSFDPNEFFHKALNAAGQRRTEEDGSPSGESDTERSKR